MLIAEGVGVVRGERLVLQDIDLALRPGELTAVLGPNGAGKSTLLGALCGELQAQTGRVSLDGRLLSRWPPLERARRLAVLAQHSSLGFAFAVEEVVAMGRLPHASGREHDQEVVDQAMRSTDIMHLRTRSYLKLSAGEQQRVHLARVLAQLWPGGQGQVLLLDEPTSSLDPRHQYQLLDVVRTFVERGGTALAILHDLNLAARYGDKLVLIAEGTVRSAGSAEQVLVPERVQQVFGLEVLVQPHPERGHPLVIAR
ncbi:heme ABC transporter ATP-binding protein [Stutzerimonas tarimensis]|uniref:Heme ABC transporter ATP-binding protein n=1 Tax=Stutzerimonas tarimensis TaxID=1507735 RepID=A0ABV7T1Z3_9GAMM